MKKIIYKLQIKLLIIVSFLFVSCLEKTEISPLNIYNDGYNQFGFSIVTTPNLYLVTDNLVVFLENFNNYIQVLYYSNNYIVINENIIPYNKIKMIFLNIQSGDRAEIIISNDLEYLHYGGHIDSYNVCENEDLITVLIGYKNNNSLYIFNKQSLSIKYYNENKNDTLCVNDLNEKNNVIQSYSTMKLDKTELIL